MRTDKWLYFRTVADVDNDDGVDGNINWATSAMIPANRLINMNPTSDTVLRLGFYSVKVADTSSSRYQRTSTPHYDHIDLNITANKHKEVMETITSAINSPSRIPFIVIADDMTTDIDNNTVVAEYIDSNITSVGTLYLFETPQGNGMHEYFATVSPSTDADAADEVAATVPITLPNECVILEAALTPLTLAGNDIGSVALEYHTAAISDGGNSAGTEIVGADTLNLKTRGNDDYAGTTATVDNTSVPDADLDISSNALAGKGIHSGVMDPIATGANTTYFHVTAKADLSTMTGGPVVGVYIRWWGRAATALA